MDDSSIALLILGGVIVLFILNRLPVALVALAVPLSLWVTGIAEVDQAFSGFGDPVIVFIASLFVVSDAIDRTGLTTWAGNRVVAVAGTGRSRLLVAVMALCAVMTALISLNGSVAALLPMVVALAVRAGRSPSTLLMPMVYAGSAGSLLVLAGSPVNVIVADAVSDVGEATLSYFEFAWLGVPVLAATILIAVFAAPRLLPERASVAAPHDFSGHAAQLAGFYDLHNGVARLRVRERSPLIGSTNPTTDIGDAVAIVAVQRSDATDRWSADGLAAGDVLVVRGSSDQISRVAVEHSLAIALKPHAADNGASLFTRETGVAEVVIAPRSGLVGETVVPGMRRASELVVLAVRRRGVDVGATEIELDAGDSVLVYGTWDALDTLVEDRDLLVVDTPELLRRQVPLGSKAAKAAIVLVAMVALLAFGIVPPAIAGLLAAGALVLSGVLSSPQAFRAVSWETVVLVGALIPLSAAIQNTGAGERIADAVLAVIGSSSPRVALAAMFVLTAVLGLVISNTATILIVLPIGLSMIDELGINPTPVMMMLGLAASAALLTPVQTPGNLMVMSPGGYRFSDYARLGAPIMLAWLAIGLTVIPLVWPL